MQLQVTGQFTIRRSEQFADFIKAMIAVQAELKPALKKAENPHFRSKYADHIAIWEACQGPLTKNGFCHTQVPCLIDGKLHLVTTIFHLSGQWMEGIMPILTDKSTMQSIGSALTYAKRYSLQSMVGVVSDDDDDANLASGKTAGEQQQRPPARQQQPQTPQPISQPQMKAIFAAAAKANWKTEHIDGFIKKHLGLESKKDIKTTHFKKILEFISTHPMKKPPVPAPEENLGPEPTYDDLSAETSDFAETDEKFPFEEQQS